MLPVALSQLSWQLSLMSVGYNALSWLSLFSPWVMYNCTTCLANVIVVCVGTPMQTVLRDLTSMHTFVNCDPWVKISVLFPNFKIAGANLSAHFKNWWDPNRVAAKTKHVAAQTNVMWFLLSLLKLNSSFSAPNKDINMDKYQTGTMR